MALRVAKWGSLEVPLCIILYPPELKSSPPRPDPVSGVA